MDPVKAIEWWLDREGPDCVPAIEIGASSEVRSLREDMAAAADEIERLREENNSLHRLRDGMLEILRKINPFVAVR